MSAETTTAEKNGHANDNVGTINQPGRSPDPVTEAVNFLILKVNEDLTNKCLDVEDQPCIELKKDAYRRLYRIYDKDNKPALRTRSYLRNLYRFKTDEKHHLSQQDLQLVIDYLAEDAYEGGRKQTSAVVSKEGDYNFEAVCVFVNSLTAPKAATTGLGNELLNDLAAKDPNSKTPHRLTHDEAKNRLTLELRTADLWYAVNSDKIAVQVRADKATLFKATNYFSRRLDELEDQFRKMGIDLTVSRKEIGSWTTIVRRDDVFQPDPTILVKPDDTQSSASVAPSVAKVAGVNSLDKSDDPVTVEAKSKKVN